MNVSSNEFCFSKWKSHNEKESKKELTQFYYRTCIWVCMQYEIHPFFHLFDRWHFFGGKNQYDYILIASAHRISFKRLHNLILSVREKQNDRNDSQIVKSQSIDQGSLNVWENKKIVIHRHLSIHTSILFAHIWLHSASEEFIFEQNVRCQTKECCTFAHNTKRIRTTNSYRINIW